MSEGETSNNKETLVHYFVRPTATVSASSLALALALVGGCAANHDPTSTSSNSEVVEQGSDTNAVESNTESLSTSFIGGGSGSLSLASAHELTGGGELYAQGFGDVAKGFYQPAGCLTVTDDLTAKKATYVFSDCTGPWGLVHIKGTVTVGYSSSAGNQLTLTYSAKGLSLNNATIDWDATANTTANGLARDMVWDGHFTGTTGNGRSFQRTNHKEYKWTAGQQCLTVNGSSDGTVTGHELKIDVVSFSVCKGGCPEAGSEIKVSDVSTNKVYDVKWNAGNATYTGPEGRTVTYTPLCAR